MAHIGNQRFRAGYGQEHGTEHEKPGHPVRGHELYAVKRIDGRQYLRRIGNEATRVPRQVKLRHQKDPSLLCVALQRLELRERVGRDLGLRAGLKARELPVALAQLWEGR